MKQFERNIFEVVNMFLTVVAYLIIIKRSCILAFLTTVRSKTKSSGPLIRNDLIVGGSVKKTFSSCCVT